jgi:hypothetical protein
MGTRSIKTAASVRTWTTQPTQRSLGTRLRDQIPARATSPHTSARSTFTGQAGSPISAADRDAFVTFIDNGGVVIANNDRSTLAPFTELFPLYAAYGVTPPNNQLTSGITSVANSAHPIISGLFGNVISFSLSDAGRFTASGDAFTTLMRWENGDIAAGLVDTAPGRKGALILLPDVEATGVSFNCCSNPSSAANNLGLNAWAYAAQVAFAADNPAEVSEPSMLALFGLSAAAFAVAARRRRKAAPDAVVAG